MAGRDQTKVDELIDDLSAVGVTTHAAPSIEDSVRVADIVCAATHTDKPVVRYDWLRPGTLVNSVGYNTSGAGEVDAATIRHALIVVDSRAAALAVPPAGAVELRAAIASG